MTAQLTTVSLSTARILTVYTLKSDTHLTGAFSLLARHCHCSQRASMGLFPVGSVASVRLDSWGLRSWPLRTPRSSSLLFQVPQLFSAEIRNTKHAQADHGSHTVPTGRPLLPLIKYKPSFRLSLTCSSCIRFQLNRSTGTKSCVSPARVTGKLFSKWGVGIYNLQTQLQHVPTCLITTLFHYGLVSARNECHVL